MLESVKFSDGNKNSYPKNTGKVLLILCGLIILSCAEIYLTSSSPKGSWIVNVMLGGHSNQANDDGRQQWTSSSHQKVILLWNGFFGDTNWKSHFDELGGPVIRFSSDEDDNRTCLLTRHRFLLKGASGVVFHGRNFDFNDLPQVRAPQQRWVFYLMESPHHSGFDANAWNKATALGFNWTMYYTFKSDSRFAYGYVLPVNYSTDQVTAINQRIDSFAANFSSRPYDAVWIVSNCQTPSKREQVVARLRAAGLKIDLWGRCYSRSPDEEIKKLGEAAFFSRYRFQIAMENSICDDYVSEKFFNALKNSERYGVIPVVNGRANYSQLLAPGSVIDASPRSNIGEVITTMKSLSNPDQQTTVRRYLEWQTRLAVDERPYTVPSWQALCQKLWNDAAEPPKTLANIRSPLGECYD